MTIRQSNCAWFSFQTVHRCCVQKMPDTVTDTSCTEVTFILIPCGQFHGNRNRKIVESNDEKPIILRVPCILLPEEDRQINQK